MTFPLLTEVLFVLDLFLRVYFCFRIVQRRLPVGTSWAWLSLILLLPVFGTVLYVYLGEYRMGRRRLRRMAAASEAIRNLVQKLYPKEGEEAALEEPARSFSLAARGYFSSPLLLGNQIGLLRDADEAFPQMIADIDRAEISCDMEFYIWSDGGRADEFGEALIRAAQRGVRCRVLVDQIGSKAFLDGPMAKNLKQNGIELRAALPSGLIRSFFARPDLRIHRKIMIIDGRLGYTGSLNLADPTLFKADAGVGQWVDAFCRIQGPAVQALAFVFLSDWCVETGQEFAAHQDEFPRQPEITGHDTRIQCLPSGPAIRESAIEQLLITAIYSARRELIITTPYFVPSEALLYALTATAHRGVDVTLIVPARVDSKMIQYGSRAFLGDLAEAGVRVALFNGGLLHTKSVAVDGEFCLFGSLNMDPRSLRINFEITLAIYDRDFTKSLNDLQRNYLRKSTIAAPSSLTSTGLVLRLKEDLARLVGPLL